MRAALLIEQIEELLDRLDSTGGHTEVYRRYLPAWRRILFSYPNGWTGNGTASIDQTARDHLSTLSFMLRDVVATPDADRLGELADYLDTIFNNLTEDPTLSKSVKDATATVITHLRGCIDDLQVLGDFEFEKAFERLIGALALVTLKSNQKDRWTEVVKNLVYPYFVNNIPSLDAAGHTFKALLMPDS